MAPNTQDEKIKPIIINIEVKDRLKLNSEGYLWQKGFFSHYQTRLLQTWSDEIYESAVNLIKAEKAGVKTGSKMIAIRDRHRTDLVCRVENMSSCMGNIKGFIKGVLIPYLEHLTGEKWILLKDKLFFRWPDKKSDVGGAKDGVPVHQDLFCYDFDQEYGPANVLTIRIPIDVFTRNNGCTEIAKNWKRFAKIENGRFILPSVQSGSAKGTVRRDISNKIDFEPILANPGDLVLVDPFVPHGAGDNTSDTPRRCFIFSFNKLDDGNFNKGLYERKLRQSSWKSTIDDFPTLDD